MNQVKVGKFIAERRKLVGLTQVQLAEMLNITDRAISKWETGKSLPDASIMLKLCSILKITVNDLLNGEVVNMNDYKDKNDELLIELTRQREKADEQLLRLEVIIGLFSVIVLLSFSIFAYLMPIADWIKTIIVIAGLSVGMLGITYALKIEQTAGYYKCEKCNHKYVPKFSNVFWAMHFGRIRYMKCPECGKKSWQKKVISKE